MYDLEAQLSSNSIVITKPSLYLPRIDLDLTYKDKQYLAKVADNIAKSSAASPLTILAAVIHLFDKQLFSISLLKKRLGVSLTAVKRAVKTISAFCDNDSNTNQGGFFLFC